MASSTAPLQPVQEVRGENDFADNLPSVSAAGKFRLVTEETTLFCDLMKALTHLVGGVTVYATSKGIEINELVSGQSIFISVKIAAEKFTHYYCDTPISFCFEPGKLNTHLKRCKIGYMMEWTMKQETKLSHEKEVFHYLSVTCQKGDDARGVDYEAVFNIPLLRTVKDRLTCDKYFYQYMAALDTLTVSSMMKHFEYMNSELENRVKISVDSDGLVFYAKGAVAGSINQMEWKIYWNSASNRNKSATQLEPAEDVTVGSLNLQKQDCRVGGTGAYFNLDHLLHLQSCITLDSDYTTVYIRADSPLIISSKVGAIGDIHCVLMCMDPQEME
jgi:hypothetical protein